MSLATDSAAFRAYPKREQRIVITALLLLPLLQVSIRLTGVGRSSRALDRLPRARRTIPPNECDNFSAFVGQAVNGAARRWHLASTSCLPRAVLCWWLLRRQGIESEVHIGIPDRATGFVAHAWVERNGRVLTDLADVRERHDAFSHPIDPLRMGVKR
ncbi:MAG: lasso peptide biosynthesis B2 protein [Acidimicrobiia bacterium]